MSLNVWIWKKIETNNNNKKKPLSRMYAIMFLQNRICKYIKYYRFLITKLDQIEKKNKIKM